MDKHEIIALGVRAEKFREEAQEWFNMLRSAELATIAQNFETMTPENETANREQIAQSGAKLSAIADLIQQLHSLEANAEAERGNEEEQ